MLLNNTKGNPLTDAQVMRLLGSYEKMGKANPFKKMNGLNKVINVQKITEEHEQQSRQWFDTHRDNHFVQSTISTLDGVKKKLEEYPCFIMFTSERCLACVYTLELLARIEAKNPIIKRLFTTYEFIGLNYDEKIIQETSELIRTKVQSIIPDFTWGLPIFFLGILKTKSLYAVINMITSSTF